MSNKGRSQCIVVKDNKLLMAKHKIGDDEWRCLPGGAVEDGETWDDSINYPHKK